MALIVLKTINRCNFACTYCFTDKSGKMKKVEIPLIESLYNKIKHYLISDNSNSVELQWHGGEPLLLGRDFYKKVFEIQSEINSEVKSKIIHSFQSNLTLLTEEYLQIIMQLNLKNFGTSLDPDPALRSFKNKNNTEKYLSVLLKALRLLEEKKIGYGINYVVTKKSLEDYNRIFYYLSNIGLTGTVSVNPVLINTKTLNYLRISPEEFSGFVRNTFPLWWKHQISDNSMEPYRSLLDAAKSINSVDKEKESYPEIPVIIDSKGDYYHPKESRSLGNMQYSTLEQMVETVKSFNIQLINKYGITRKCKSCKLWTHCYCNTLMDAFSQNDYFSDDKWCRTRRILMNNYLLQFLKTNNEAA